MSILAEERDTYEELLSSVAHYEDTSPGKNYVGKFLDMAKLTPNPDTTILDAGCATGQGGLELRRRGFEKVELMDITDAGLVPEAVELPFHECSLWHPLKETRIVTYPNLDEPVVAVRPGSWDYVFCCDVLEHFQAQFTMLAIHHMLQAARKGVFLSIAMQPDNFGVWVGRPLHQTVQPFWWWKDSIAEVAKIVECTDLLIQSVFYLESK